MLDCLLRHGDSQVKARRARATLPRQVPLCIALTTESMELFSTMLADAVTSYLESNSQGGEEGSERMLCSMLHLLGQQASWADKGSLLLHPKLKSVNDADDCTIMKKVIRNLTWLTPL